MVGPKCVLEYRTARPRMLVIVSSYQSIQKFHVDDLFPFIWVMSLCQFATYTSHVRLSTMREV